MARKLLMVFSRHGSSEVCRGVTRFMFDTSVFGKILKMETPEALLKGERRYFVTHVQRDELNAAPRGLRDKLLSVLQIIPQQSIATETLVWGVSRWGEAKWGDNHMYTVILQRLDDAKPMEHLNNIKDALIATTAIKNEIVLVTDDKILKNTVQELGGQAVSFEAFQKGL